MFATRKVLPGTVVEFSDDSLRVATATDDIKLSEFTDINGEKCDIKLKKGKILPLFEQNFLHKLEQCSEQLAKSELYWVQTFEQSKALDFWSITSGNDAKRAKPIKKLIYTDQAFKNKIFSLLPENVDATNAPL